MAVSVVDDDTGSAQWSDAAPLYLLDLDNDADNDWDIDGDDDPIEHVPPGRYVLVNDDDDNANGIADGNESGPVSGEDDLEPFMIRWAPANRPEEPIRNYFGWNLTLVVHGPGVQLWSNPDKTGPQVLQEYPPGWGVNWVIGVDPIPSTLYLEALSATTPGGIQLDLLLTGPQWGPTDADTVVFTAAPPDVTVNLWIADGVGGNIVPDADEDKTGAVTVANLNDTDADGTIDNGDDTVKETRTGAEAHGRNEVDLMPLHVFRPVPYSGGPVTLTVTPANRVALWWKPTKEDRVEEYDPDTGTASLTFNLDTERFKTMYVELQDKSAAVGDVTLTLSYMGVSDTVIATGVWSRLIDHESDTKSWEQLAGTVWRTEMEQRLQDEIEFLGGTGRVRPRTKGGLVFFLNVIIMEFEMYPPKVDKTIPRVKFDLTRQALTREWLRIRTTGEITLKAKTEWPIPWELPNDDPEGPDVGDVVDESYAPNNKGHMFVFDAPGLGIQVIKDDTDKRWNRQNFYQFARVSFTKPPEGDNLLGSICSDRVKFHSQTTLVWDDATGKWKRTADAENEIGLGHLVINEGG